MKTLISNSKFNITFNGSSTYFVSYNEGDCVFATSSKVKANNFYKKASKCAGAK